MVPMPSVFYPCKQALLAAKGRHRNVSLGTTDRSPAWPPDPLPDKGSDPALSGAAASCPSQTGRLFAAENPDPVIRFWLITPLKSEA
jgi:hypothetical protein